MDMVCFCVYLLSGKLDDIQQLALFLLWKQPGTLHQVMSFLGKVHSLLQ